MFSEWKLFERPLGSNEQRILLRNRNCSVYRALKSRTSIIQSLTISSDQCKKSKDYIGKSISRSNLKGVSVLEGSVLYVYAFHVPFHPYTITFIDLLLLFLFLYLFSSLFSYPIPSFLPDATEPSSPLPLILVAISIILGGAEAPSYNIIIYAREGSLIRELSSSRSFTSARLLTRARVRLDLTQNGRPR